MNIREAYSIIVQLTKGKIYSEVRSKTVPFLKKVLDFQKKGDFENWQAFLANSLPSLQQRLGDDFHLSFPVQNFRKSYNDVMHPKYLWRDGHIPTFRRGSFLFGPAEMKIFFFSLMEYDIPFFYEDAHGVSHSHENFDPRIL